MNGIDTRPMLVCGQCGHTWRQVDIRYKPRRCPSCDTKFWRMPKGFMDTPDRRFKRLHRACMDVLLTNDICHIGRTPEGQLLALTPYMATRWKAVPDLYGDLLEQCNRASCEAVVMRLTGPKAGVTT